MRALSRVSHVVESREPSSVPIARRLARAVIARQIEQGGPVLEWQMLKAGFRRRRPIAEASPPPPIATADAPPNARPGCAPTASRDALSQLPVSPPDGPPIADTPARPAPGSGPTPAAEAAATAPDSLAAARRLAREGSLVDAFCAATGRPLPARSARLVMHAGFPFAAAQAALRAPSL